MTHLSEERNVPTGAGPIWRIVSDTTRWPQFYATPKEHGRLRAVEYLDGATRDGPEVKRRLHFTALPAWEEQVVKWVEREQVSWIGIRNPGQKYWTQQFELIPGRGFTTVRWDVFYELTIPRPARKVFRRTMEDLMWASLERVERLALAEAQRGAEAPYDP